MTDESVECFDSHYRGKWIHVEPIPANPGYMAHTVDYEELYGTSSGDTPGEALQNHKEWMDFKDEQ